MKKLNKFLLTGALIFSLVNCGGPKKTLDMQTEPNLIEDSRYSIKRVEVFKDDLAYEGKRGIYEITDHKTGVTYLGVSGIGITELGSHPVGKTIVKDER